MEGSDGDTAADRHEASNGEIRGHTDWPGKIGARKSMGVPAVSFFPMARLPSLVPARFFEIRRLRY